MDVATFHDLLRRITPVIIKNDTTMRESIPPAQRLALTLRFMATGESQKSLSYAFRIADCTISKIVHETTEAIYNALKDEFLQVPSKAEEWIRISNDFMESWQFPNCIGALDGKHVKIVPPAGSGSDFFNYKKSFSVVLMALVNSNYEFVFVDVGTNGRISDGGVWGKCELRAAIEKNTVSIPDPRTLPNSSIQTPFVAVADEAFGLKTYLMRPYPGRDRPQEERIYNYRLSRARRVVENAFGILSNRWRFLLGTINLGNLTRIENLVLCACALHNYLSRRKTSRTLYVPDHLIDREDENGNVIPGSWRSDYENGTYSRPNFGVNRTSFAAKYVQNLFKQYFNNEGAVEWQADRI